MKAIFINRIVATGLTMVTLGIASVSHAQLALQKAGGTGSIGFTKASPDTNAEIVRPEIGKLLRAAQELIGSKQYHEALVKIQEAGTINGKTPYEYFLLDQMRGAAASAAGDIELAATSFDAAIGTGRLPAADQIKIIEVMVNTCYRGKDYRKTITWAQRYLNTDGSNEAIRSMMIKSQYLLGDYADVVKALTAKFQEDDKVGRIPSEQNLQLLGNSYQHTKDVSGYENVLERLLAHYPKKEYWLDMLARLQNRPEFGDRWALDLLRLQLAVGAMSNANHYTEMAQLALQAGFPAEAREVMNKGFDAGVLGMGPEANRHMHLRDLVNRKAAEDLKTLEAGAENADAASSAAALVNMGYNYAMSGKLEKGIQIMESGIGKRGLKHPEDAKLHLGEVYILAGDSAKAKRLLQSVQGIDGAADLARLWQYVR